MEKTHYVPITGSRKARFRKGKVYAAESQNAAVTEAQQATGDCGKAVRSKTMPPAA
jgi:hypothetical protein